METKKEQFMTVLNKDKDVIDILAIILWTKLKGSKRILQTKGAHFIFLFHVL